MKQFGILSFIVLAMILTSCAPKNRAIIWDSNGLEKEVYNLTTVINGKKAIVKDGLAFRTINFEDIGVIKIIPDQTSTQDGSLYYLTEIWMVNGDKVQPYKLKNNKESLAFINVSDEIVAETESGIFRIKLKNVKQIKFLSL